MNTSADDVTTCCPIDQETVQDLNTNLQMVLQKYQETNFETDASLLVSGAKYLLKEDFEQAETEFWQALMINPRLADGYYFIGYIRRVQKNFKQALTFFQLCLKINPTHLQALEERSAIRLAKRDFTGALKDFQRLIKQQPFCAKWFLIRAKIYSALSMADKAVEDLKTVFSLNAELIDRQFRSEMSRQTAKYEFSTMAPSLSGQAFRANLSEAYLQTGLQRQRKLEVKQALEYYEHAILLDSSNSGAYFLRGEMKFKLKDFAAALTDLTLSLQYEPGQSEAHFLRGNVLWKQGHAADAIEDFNKAIELNGCDGKIFYARGLAYMDLNNESAGHKDLIMANELGFAETLQNPWTLSGRH